MPRRELRDWLDQHVDLERGVGVAPQRRVEAPTLDRVEQLLGLLGEPHRDVPVVHITGTNGKTSTARMCGALFEAVGLRAGSYTSPHLSEMNERIGIGGASITDDALDEMLEAVRRAEPSVSDALSYFEILTGAAYRWFADEAVDVAVVEVGLGGTWDATNVADGQVAVITNVSIDHVEYLGPTRQEIAREKAGIVKPTSDFVLGETASDLAEIFDARPAASLLRRGRDFGATQNRLAVGGRVLDLFTPWATYPEIFLPVHGAHQGHNAAIALAAVESFLGRALGPDVVADAFGAVRTPGRLEIVGRNPLVVLDGAHNVGGAQSLVQSLGEAFPDGPRTLVVGLLEQKDPIEMLSALDVHNSLRVVACRPSSPRARSPQDVAHAARELGVAEERIDICDSVGEAIGTAMLETPADGQVVITGTLYLVGEARGILVHE